MSQNANIAKRVQHRNKKAKKAKNARWTRRKPKRNVAEVAAEPPTKVTQPNPKVVVRSGGTTGIQKYCGYGTASPFSSTSPSYSDMNSYNGSSYETSPYPTDEDSFSDSDSRVDPAEYNKNEYTGAGVGMDDQTLIGDGCTEFGAVDGVDIADNTPFGRCYAAALNSLQHNIGYAGAVAANQNRQLLQASVQVPIGYAGAVVMNRVVESNQPLPDQISYDSCIAGAIMTDEPQPGQQPLDGCSTVAIMTNEPQPGQQPLDGRSTVAITTNPPPLASNGCSTGAPPDQQQLDGCSTGDIATNQSPPDQQTPASNGCSTGLVTGAPSDQLQLDSGNMMAIATNQPQPNQLQLTSDVYSTGAVVANPTLPGQPPLGSWYPTESMHEIFVNMTIHSPYLAQLKEKSHPFETELFCRFGQCHISLNDGVKMGEPSVWYDDTMVKIFQDAVDYRNKCIGVHNICLLDPIICQWIVKSNMCNENERFIKFITKEVAKGIENFAFSINSSGNHWYSMFINFQTGKPFAEIRIIDVIRFSHRNHLVAARDLLVANWHIIHPGRSQTMWKLFFHLPDESPLMTDGCSCGPFSCIILDLYCLGIPINKLKQFVNQGNIDEFRRRIAIFLCGFNCTYVSHFTF